MTLKKEDRLGGRSQATSTKSIAADSLSVGADAWNQPPNPEGRAVQHAVEVLHEYGYGIAMRCLDCRHPIFTISSLRRMRGPRCAARHHASLHDDGGQVVP